MAVRPSRTTRSGRRTSSVSEQCSTGQCGRTEGPCNRFSYRARNATMYNIRPVYRYRYVVPASAIVQRFAPNALSPRFGYLPAGLCVTFLVLRTRKITQHSVDYYTIQSQSSQRLFDMAFRERFYSTVVCGAVGWGGGVTSVVFFFFFFSGCATFYASRFDISPGRVKNKYIPIWVYTQYLRSVF